jgi:hypothetical protein
MEVWLTDVFVVVAAVAGAANPATARIPVSRNVAASFFIRWSFQSISAITHYVRQYTVKPSIAKLVMDRFLGCR